MSTTQDQISDRAGLLKYLRDAHGFKGKASLAEVKTFIDDTIGGIEFVDSDNEPMTLDAVWAKMPSLKQAKAPDGEEVEVETKSANDSHVITNADKRKALFEAQAKAERRSERAGNDRVFSIKTFKSNLARKRYEASIKAGTSKFASVDEMQVFNAAWRVRMAEIHVVDRETYSKATEDEDRAIIGKDGTELVNTLGGALIATDHRPGLVWLTEPYGICRNLANMVDMTGGDTRFSRKTAIPTFTHAAQGSTMTAQDISYDNINLVPKQVYGLIKTNRQLFRDAVISVADDIANSMLEGYWLRADGDYFNGNGAAAEGNQIGLVGYFLGAYTGSIKYTTSNAWSTTTKDDFEACIGLVQNCDPRRFKWVMSRQAFANTAMRLAIAVGGTQPGQFLSATYIDGSNMGQLLGYPVYFCASLPTATPSSSSGTATSSSIWAYFGDFESSSMVGFKGQLEITPSEHAGFIYNQLWTRGVGELAVNIHGDGRTSSKGPIAALSN